MSTAEATLEEQTLRNWIGRTRSSTDRIDRGQANRLRATLDSSRSAFQEGDVLPAGWHWIYFLDAPGIDELGRDGHAALGDFLPPVALPQRMWAGTRLRFHSPIRLGEEIKRVSEVTDVVRKTGSSGELCFVTVHHSYYLDTELKLEEDHNIVYRGDGSSDKRREPPVAETSSDDSIVVTPTTTLLFRYSALTFNGHRIHYDLDFCREVEGYPGLVVHAPLTATMMLGLAEKHFADRNVTFREFRQRSVSPLFHYEPFSIHLREGAEACELWAASATGRLAAKATVEFA